MSSSKPKATRFQIRVWSKLLEGRISLQKVLIASEFLTPSTTNSPDEDSLKSVEKLLKVLVRLRDTYRGLVECKLSSLEDKYAVIDKWYEKTKIATIPKKGYTALELPTSQLIKNALKDKERLIRRMHKEDEPETFKDDDFYYQLLKQVISKDESRRWVELQRFRGKAKRRADTKATKGRKIKKDILPKLVNFMAPVDSNEVPEQIRNSIIKCLFG